MFRFGGVAIRVVEDRDLEPMRQLRNDPSTWPMLTDVALIDAQAQRDWFQRIRTATNRRYYVVCDDDHDFIGIVRMDEIDTTNRSIRIGADIVPELRRKGYANRVFALLERYCFDTLNMHRLWLLVLETNQAAQALYQKRGFREEGRLTQALFRDGAYRDYILMYRLEDDYRAQAAAGAGNRR